MNGHLLAALASTLMAVSAAAITGSPIPEDMRDAGSSALHATSFVQVVEIDIKVGDPRNRIVRYFPAVAVAVLSSPTFDPLTIHTGSLRFGRTGAEQSLTVCRRPFIDINDDTRPDLICGFDISRAGWQRGDTLGLLSAVTTGGQTITGAASVTLSGRAPILRRTGGRF